MVEKFKQYDLAFVSWYGHSEMCILAYDASVAEAARTGPEAFANLVMRKFPDRFYAMNGLSATPEKRRTLVGEVLEFAPEETRYRIRTEFGRESKDS